MLETLDVRLTQAQSGELGHLDFLQVLRQDEISRRETVALERRMRKAKFEQQATLEDFDFNASSELPTAQIRDLAALHWLHSGESVILFGPVGVGQWWTRARGEGAVGRCRAWAVDATRGAARRVARSMAAAAGAVFRLGSGHRPDSGWTRRAVRPGKARAEAAVACPRKACLAFAGGDGRPNGAERRLSRQAAGRRAVEAAGAKPAGPDPAPVRCREPGLYPGSRARMRSMPCPRLSRRAARVSPAG
ncbi:ATP-binding protein [Streptomyces collinus]|uniref:ATP-binding protein n=1 Tax=Streptomyces collinus TaxID=42684 RepID=UPI0029428562|nr:ATP-binding protein [Streptomyces collinus]